MWCFVLWYVDYSVHVEADFFGVGGPVLVAEAVRVLSVVARFEGVVAGADGALLNQHLAGGCLDLWGGRKVAVSLSCFV